MLDVPFFTFRNSHKETLVSRLGVWNPYRKPRSKGWKSGIPVENMGLGSGKVGCLGPIFEISESL